MTGYWSWWWGNNWPFFAIVGFLVLAVSAAVGVVKLCIFIVSLNLSPVQFGVIVLIIIIPVISIIVYLSYDEYKKTVGTEIK